MFQWEHIIPLRFLCFCLLNEVFDLQFSTELKKIKKILRRQTVDEYFSST